MGVQTADAAATTRWGSTWRAVLVTITVLVATVDLVHQVLISQVVPPLAAGVVLTAVGVALVRVRPRAGLVFLAVLSGALLVGGAPFAIPHLTHPASGLDFTHAVVGTVGRLLAIVAALAGWRGASEVMARRVATAGASLLAATVTVAGVASLVTTGQRPHDTDLRAEIHDAAFPDSLEVASGDTAFVDNQDLFRHTFTVVGTEVDVDLPARQGRRVRIGLEPGVYEVVCDIPGHEAMVSTLRVE